MYVILKKVEVIKEVIGPFHTKDAAVAEKKERQKKSRARLIVRKMETPNNWSEE